jgi:poly(3-hydroxybutyrate) depolymerase
MLAAYPEVFAAGAIIAGLPHDAASNLHEAIGVMHQVPQRSGKQWGDAVRRASKHKGPWPRVSVWHGDADRIVGISNQGAILAQWQDVHRLTAPPKTARTDTAQHLSWRDDQGRTLLESYTVPGLGHGIPIKPGTDSPGTGGDCCGQPGPFILDAGISSSVRIAEFFGLTESRAAGVPKKPSVIAPVIARLAAILPEPPRSPPAESVEGEILDASPIKRVIVKALTAAGLIRKN